VTGHHHGERGHVKWYFRLSRFDSEIDNSLR
jgi:hypothetical protein